MNDENLRRKIATLAQDSSRVFFNSHSRKKMRARKVTLSQVLHVLRRGQVTEGAHKNIKGNWQCTLACNVAGDYVKVAAALDDSGEESVIVITVMN